MAVGQMGMSLADALTLEPEELGHIRKAWVEQQEANIRSRWEQSRFLAYCGMMPYQRKGKRLKPQDIITFPWEKKEKPRRATREDIERISRRFGRE